VATFTKLNSDQETAATTLDRHVSVTAGPGSGKTTVLVARYLHILRQKEISVDQIVAITFTNRAANEMRTRLRSQLDRLMREGDKDERAKWLRHKRALDGAVITTFHGFCARLLREFPLEAEIDPQFTLLDEMQSRMMLEAVTEETLTEFINSGHDDITRLVVAVGRASVRDAALQIYRTMRGQGLSLDEIEHATVDSHATIDDYANALELADALMLEFIALPKLSAGAEEKRKRAAAMWREVRTSLAAIPDASELAEYCEAIEELRAAARPTKAGKVHAIVSSLDDVLWGADSKEPYGRLPKVCFDLRAREFALDTIGVVRQIEHRLEEEKRRTASLDFDDLHARVLKLFDQRPDVLNRIADRYRYFLVDEFQDTNRQQRELMRRLALSRSQRANLFIVGDRKQSIYGFRGADVDVFRSMTEEIEGSGGLSSPLSTNFRSRRPLIEGFNHFFAHVFQLDVEMTETELNELGWVEHEASVAGRETEDEGPIIEILLDIRNSQPAEEGSEANNDTSRERDAKQIASRILSLVTDTSKVRYRDIALLFRAMSGVAEYESVFRRLGIPYHTVQGKGFYAREEITDLLQLLRFLDNTTDEIALASALRSPLCGLSDDALLALRCGPTVEERYESGRLRRVNGVRGLLDAVMQFERIAFIADEELDALARSRAFLSRLIENRSRLPVADLLRISVAESEFRSVIAANFDGAQRLANVEKLFELAERFERSGANMIRDFVRFVEDFERSGGRESEGQLDESADAVRLMTIHQSKGQEFPVVVLPELTRELTRTPGDWFMFDRHRGLTVKVPDGRGGKVSGLTLERLRDRAACRNIFEAMRLYYVAATRAQDRLVFSGASAREIKLDGKGQTCMKWTLSAMGLSGDPISGPVAVSDSVNIHVFRNLADESMVRPAKATSVSIENELNGTITGPFEFPLLKPLAPERAPAAGDNRVPVPRDVALRLALHRFSVTQLVNFQRCPRQYFFDRILNTPSLDELNAWNEAEQADAPANLTATLRGAVVHRFCEVFRAGDDVTECLASSFDYVAAQRSTGVGGQIDEEERQKAIHALLPLARNYLNSSVAGRIEAARNSSASSSEANVFDERTFVVRRPLGTLSGVIDKMIVAHDAEAGANEVEIVDFKTDRFPKHKAGRASRSAQLPDGQASFEFAGQPKSAEDIRAEVAEAAIDYQLQMQAYALAVHELVPNMTSLRVTIHFLDPNIEESVPEELLTYDACAESLDKAMAQLLASAPASYPTRPAEHCRFCSFRQICVAGQEWFRMQG
jgi:ATP-dependent helicase/nuclease subunit A